MKIKRIDGEQDVAENQDTDVTGAEETNAAAGAEGAQETDAAEERTEEGTDEGTGGDEGAEEEEIVLPGEYADDPAFVDFVQSSSLNQQQVDEGIKYMEARKKLDKEAKDKADAEGAAALKEEWGDDFKSRMAAAKQAVKVLDKRVPGTVDFLKETGAATDPRVIRLMAEIGAGLTGSGKGKPAVKKAGEKKRVVKKQPVKTQEKSSTTVRKKKRVVVSNKATQKKKKTGWDLPPLSRLHPSE